MPDVDVSYQFCVRLSNAGFTDCCQLLLSIVMAVFNNMSLLVVLVVCSVVLVSSQACVPDCILAANACGPDGCGGSCGTCKSGTVCQPILSFGENEPPASGFQYFCQPSNGTCLPLSFEYDQRVGTPPSKNSALDYCKQYSSKTCCTQGYSQNLLPAADPISCLFAKLGSSCNNLFLLFSCISCHPQVGTGAITNIPCKSFCDKVWNSCKGSKLLSTPDLEDNVTTLFPVSSGGKSISSIYGTELAFFQALTSNSTTTEAIFPDPLLGCQYYYDSNPNNDPDQSTCFSGENRLVSSVLVSVLLLMLSLRAM